MKRFNKNSVRLLSQESVGPPSLPPSLMAQVCHCYKVRLVGVIDSASWCALTRYRGGICYHMMCTSETEDCVGFQELETVTCAQRSVFLSMEATIMSHGE